MEYGAIGLSEDEATASLGAENVECYISEFTPLEHALSDARSARRDAAFAKLVCDKTQDLKVIGFHYLGPNAGEITQGFSVAMRKGATCRDFRAVVIHPDVAEEEGSRSRRRAASRRPRAAAERPPRFFLAAPRSIHSAEPARCEQRTVNDAGLLLVVAPDGAATHRPPFPLLNLVASVSSMSSVPATIAATVTASTAECGNCWPTGAGLDDAAQAPSWSDSGVCR